MNEEEKTESTIGREIKPAHHFIPPSIPILNYRSPQPKPQMSRRKCVALGFSAAWGTVIITFLTRMRNGASGLLEMFILGSVAILAYSVVDIFRKRHGGFLIGALLGLLTIIGVGALTIAVVCGAFR